MELARIAIYISALSLLVGAVALGWNIYRDVILKAKLKVRLGVVEVIATGMGSQGTYVSIAGTNFGPGEIIVEKVWGTTVPRLKRLFGDRSGFIVINPTHGELPARLAVGESVTLLFQHQEESFLAKRLARVGLVDSFGRQHSAPRRDMKHSMERYQEDYPARQAAHG